MIFLRPLPRPARRWVDRHRRLVAALLAAAATCAVLAASRPPAPDVVGVLVAARDLSGGGTLAAGDVRVATFRARDVPDGVLAPDTDVTGRVLAAPARAGEPITDVRLVGAGLLAGYADEGLVAAPVRLADDGSVRLLRPGDRVDVLAAQAADVTPDGVVTSGQARTVASAVRVITIPKDSEHGLLGASGGGALVVLAVTPDQAAELAGAEAGSRLSVVLRAG